MSQDKLIFLAERLVQEKTSKEFAEECIKSANEKIELIEQEMNGIMDTLDMQSFKTGDGRLFYRYVDSFPKMKDQAAFYAWLKDHGEDGIIKQTIHPQTLRAWYKDKVLEFGEALSDKLEIFQKFRIGVRK